MLRGTHSPQIGSCKVGFKQWQANRTELCGFNTHSTHGIEKENLIVCPKKAGG